MINVFIDGGHGTTGLKISERLLNIKEYKVFTLPYEESKDLKKRIEAIESADVAVLCLPDDSAKEIVPHIKSSKIIDTSTAHRVGAGFIYGLPEIGFREEIRKANRLAVPGCHVTGYLTLTVPLMKAGIIEAQDFITCHSITGYSGGGKAMIAEYENPNRSEVFKYPRQYALGLTHKHLKEMKHYSKMDNPPVFSPILADMYSGMAVSIPLRLKKGKFTGSDVADIIAEYYKDEKLIDVAKFNTHPAVENGVLNPAYKSGKDDLSISISGNEEQVMLTSLLDNLGKGASGAALQCLNIMSGYEETLGLSL